jgi:hypothetical protein
VAVRQTEAPQNLRVCVVGGDVSSLGLVPICFRQEFYPKHLVIMRVNCTLMFQKLHHLFDTHLVVSFGEYSLYHSISRDAHVSKGTGRHRTYLAW